MMKVDVILNGDTLKADIISKKDSSNQYYFYLLKNGKVIDRYGWIEKNTFQWKLTEAGIYQIRGFIQDGEKKIDRFSQLVNFYTTDFLNNYKSFYPTGSLKKIEERLFTYHSYKEPFSDFIIIKNEEDFKINHQQISQIGGVCSSLKQKIV